MGIGKDDGFHGTLDGIHSLANFELAFDGIKRLVKLPQLAQGNVTTPYIPRIRVVSW